MVDVIFGWLPVLPDAGADVLVDGALEGEGAALRHTPAPVHGRHRRDLKHVTVDCRYYG